MLAETCRRVSAVAKGLGCRYEIVLVNDGSKDDTLEQMRRIAVEDSAFVIVNLSRNFGHQLALSAGLAHCSGARVLIMDADLQDPPELAAEMMRLMDQGADVVYAQRRTRPGDHRIKRIACAVFYRLLGLLSDYPIPLDTGDFRLMSRRVAEVILEMPERHPFLRGMVSWVGYKQVPVYYDRDARFAGETKYPLGRLVKLAFDGIMASSTKPLALASYVGLMFAVASLAFIIYALYSWLMNGKTPQGWTSLMVVVTFLGSCQLFVLAIIGKYLGRAFEQLRGRPKFIVQDVIRGGQIER